MATGSGRFDQYREFRRRARWRARHRRVKRLRCRSRPTASPHGVLHQAILPNAAPAWTDPYARIVASRSISDHLFFPVQLDGRKIDAFFDTGSQLSVLSLGAALALGVTRADLAHDRPIITLGAAAERLSSHLHRFSQLEIGDEVIHRPEFVVTDVKLNDADLVLGINFLISQRVWFSFG